MNSKKERKKNGFTLIELIIVMAIMAILIGMTFLNLFPQKRLKEFDTTVEKIVSLLNTAREKSRFQDSGLAWRVGLGNPFCSSTQPFFGLYDEYSLTTKGKYVLPESVGISSPDFNNSSSSCSSYFGYDKIFIKFTSSQGFLVGSSASATFSIFVKSNPNISSTISVSSIGVVSFSLPPSSTPPYVPYIPLPPDITPPAKIADLAVVVGGMATNQASVSLASISSLAAGGGGGIGSVALSWTAPGDDGNTGTATSYDLRYSTFPILDGNWFSYTPALGLPRPKPESSLEAFTVSGLTLGGRYYFAIKALDEVGNTSTISTVVSGLAQ